MLANILCIAAFSAVADEADDQFRQQASQNSEALLQYLVNLGKYLGYDISTPPNLPPNTSNQQLIDASQTERNETYLINTVFGAVPVNYLSSALAQFLPNNYPGASVFNAMANATFNYQNYNVPATGQSGTISVSNLMDQPTDPSGNYLKDPVSQSILNTLATPSYTYCMNNDGTAWISSCNLLFKNLVMANVVGALPSPTQYFSYTYNQPLISQLNSNSLTGPLMYSTDGAQSSTSSTPANTDNVGLQAQSQAQQAANFIRYVSGAVIPPSLPKLKDYDTLYNQAVPPSGTKVDPGTQAQAQATLTSYFNGLRVFAAQGSVGMSNLYYILSKRLPQTQGGDNNTSTSQAINEFNMASWRLFNANPSDPNNPTPSKLWVDQLNNASSATVQKEIAVLLAEINYQMYLDRQLQERILLTNTVMLMQNLKVNQPSADFSNQNTPLTNN